MSQHFASESATTHGAGLARLPLCPRRLGEADRPALREHLLRLPEADRALRFCGARSDAALAAYAAALDFARTPCFGFHDAEGRLVALAEAFPFAAGAARQVEAAFTTDREWRRRGLARALFDAVARYAREQGLHRLLVHCDGRNQAMRGLLGAVGAACSVEDGEVEAEWSVGSPRRPDEGGLPRAA